MTQASNPPPEVIAQQRTEAIKAMIEATDEMILVLRDTAETLVAIREHASDDVGREKVVALYEATAIKLGTFVDHVNEVAFQMGVAPTIPSAGDTEPAPPTERA